MRYARIAVDHEDVPAGALVCIYKRIDNSTVFTYQGHRYSANLGEKSLLIFPTRDKLLEMLSNVSPRMGIHYTASVKKFKLVNFDFGHFVLKEVPVFKGSKVVSKRKVAAVDHIDISHRSFDEVVYRTFFATLSGKLKRITINDGWQTLIYDKTSESFILSKD